MWGVLRRPPRPAVDGASGTARPTWLRPAFPVDLIVRTPEKVRERLTMGDDFMWEIIEEGKVLYEADRR